MKLIVIILLPNILMACSDNTESRMQKKSVADSAQKTAITPDNSPRYRAVKRDSSSGQTVYVPVYSHIYQQNGQKTFNLTATLSIRNADMKQPVYLFGVSYYDSKGNLIQHYLQKSKMINPLASTYFVVEEEDLRGGVGANFLVKWKSDQPVNPPVIEAVMISTSQQQGISFISTGRVLEEHQRQQQH